MQLTILLLFALSFFGVQSRCFHDYGRGWGWRYSTKYHNYQCVLHTKCFDNQYDLTPDQKWVTQTGRCFIRGAGGFAVGQVCCLHMSPPQRRFQHFHRGTPTHNPSSGPMTIFSHIPNGIQQSQTGQHTSTQISPQSQHPQSPTSSAIFHSQNANCQCIQRNRCRDQQMNNFQFTQRSCPSHNEICCHNLVPPSSTTITNSSPHSQVQAQGQPNISPSTNVNCNCIPVNECHDDDIHSDPASLIDVQSNNRPLRREICPTASHVCCYHLVHPLPIPNRNQSPQVQPQNHPHVSPQRPTVSPSLPAQSQKPFQVSPQRPTVGSSLQPQSQSPAEISSSPSSTCLCTPFFKCYDEETSSNLTGVVDDRIFVPVAEQITCPDPNEICCHNLNKPVVKPPTVSSSKGSSLQPQSQNPAEISSSPSSNCLCTPFFNCYDEETSHNLTGVVDDRSFVPVAERACSDPNDICCHNLIKPVVKPPTVSSTEDCSGSCVPIQDCPNLFNIWNEAKSGKSDAILELRNSVCLLTDERVLVCCQQNVKNNNFKR